MSTAYQPLYIVPHGYTAIVNPRGPLLERIEQAAIDVEHCCNEVWYIVPDETAQKLQQESETSHE